MNAEKRIRRAIIPGSYDPMTLGHLDILLRSAAIYDEVFLALLINPEKNYMFDAETRIKIAEQAVKDIPNAHVVYDEGMLAMLARKLGCCAIIKGIRNSEDFEYEKKMAEFNSQLAPEIETLFMPCDKDKSEISSTRVRELILQGRTDEAEKLLPPGTAEIIRKTEVYNESRKDNA